MGTDPVAWWWDHTSLTVADLDRAIEFYRAAFGYEVVFEARGLAELIEQIAGVPDLRCDLAQLRSPISTHTLELIAFRPAPPIDEQGHIRPGSAHIAFRVRDLDSALATVQRLGAVMIGAVTRFPEGRCVYCREPAGSVFELEETATGAGAQQEGGRP